MLNWSPKREKQDMGWRRHNPSGHRVERMQSHRANYRTIVRGPIPLLFAMVAAGTLFNSEPSRAALASQSAEITWSARAASQSDASKAQETLYLTLFNTGRLPLTRLSMQKGEYPGDTLRRSGAWVGNLSAAADALLCDLNRTICSRSRQQASSREQSRDTAHIAGFKIGGNSRWKASAGDTLIVPNIQIVQIYRQESGNRFSSGKETVVEAEQVVRVPACFDSGGSVCITDYQLKAGSNSVLENSLRSVTKVLPKFSKNVNDAFALVPHLTARLSIPEDRISYYSRIPTGGKFSFDDPGYKRLLTGLGNNIQGKFAGAIKSLPESEPKFPLQKSFFEQFFNVARHGQPRPHENGLPITIVVIDHKPNIKHCDFESARIEMLREPGTFDNFDDSAEQPVSASADGSTSDDCEISESPWLREFHGTHILGLAAARRNERGGAGLLSHFDNVTFKVIPINIDRLRGDENYVSELAVSIREAIFQHGAKIINLSWAYTPVDGGGQRDDIRDLIDQTKGNVVWFAAAGNEGTDANNGVCNTRPACFTHPNVAGVVAVEEREDGEGYQLLGDGTETNIGWRSFDLAAPGRDIWSTVGDHAMAKASGTSQSTIIAASAAALVLSKETLTPRAAINRLIYTSSLVPSLKHGMNGGIVDVSAALKFGADQLWLDDGCAYMGRALSLKFDNGDDFEAGDFVIDSEDPVTRDRLGPVHFNLAESRRLFFDRTTDSYIGYFVRANTQVLQRVNGDFGTRPDRRVLRFEIANARGEDCASPPQRINITVDRIEDFIRRARP